MALIPFAKPRFKVLEAEQIALLGQHRTDNIAKGERSEGVTYGQRGIFGYCQWLVDEREL